MKISIILVLCISAIWCVDVKFNRDLVSVTFNPHIFPGDSNSPADYHDKKDLKKMLTTIATKFSKVVMYTISADGFNPEMSVALIPSAVAEFNRDNVNLMEKLEVTMKYKPQLKENIHSNFDIQKKLADEANFVHNGTVSTILMYYWDGLKNTIIKSLTDSLDYANKANLQNSTLLYKLGAFLPISDCYDNVNQVQKILGKLDVLVFQMPDTSSKLTPDAYFVEVINAIKKCQLKKKMQEKNINDKIQFLVYRSDISKTGSQDVSLLTQFWSHMNRWATHTNTSIIFNEAFDTFSSTKSFKFEYTGWWRVKDGVNGSLLNFVIEEKANGKGKQNELLFSKLHFTIFKYLKTGVFNKGIATLKRPKFEGFSRKHVMVNFNPVMHEHDKPSDNSGPGLQNMLKTIYSRFNKISIDVPLSSEYKIDKIKYLVASATAYYNANKTNQNYTMEAVIASKLEMFEDVNTTSFDIAKGLADEANTIYNGTVKTILFKYRDLQMSTLETVKTQLEYSKDKISKETSFPYDVGLVLPIENCGKSGLHLPKFLIPILPLINVIYFVPTVATFYKEIGEGDHSISFSLMFKEYERCLLKIRKIKQNISVGFVSGWTELNNKGVQNIRGLVGFWERASDWALVLNTSVVMLNAFDDPNLSTGLFKKFGTFGWWKLDLTRTYNDPSEFVFVEKLTTNEAVLPKTLAENSSSNISVPTTKQGFTSVTIPKFNRNHVMVIFDPWVHENEYQNYDDYNLSGLQNMLKTISFRFSKVVIKEVPLSSNYIKGQSDTIIASATARFNANKTNQDHPMEAVITCELEMSNDMNMKTSFDIAKGLADEANAVYNGTVKTILIAYDELYMSTLKTVKAQLQYSQEQNSNESAFTYNIGMLLPISDCSRSFLKFLIQILHLINVIYFMSSYSDGAQGTSPLIFEEFEECFFDIRRINKNINFGFSAQWSDTNNKGLQNISAFVEFWGRANDWAVALNTTVIMWEAFDSPNRNNELRKTLGWWKLDRTREYQDQSEFVFLEKSSLLKVAMENTSSTSFSTSSQGLDTKSIVIFGVSGLLVVVAIIFGLAFFVYKRISKKVAKFGLTKKEMRQFFHGGALAGEGNSAGLNIYGEPYNKALELTKEDFFIDETERLGSGAFGSVFRAIIYPSTEQEKQVAVKKTTSDNPSSAVKNLLVEIKILSHVGQHENIVGIVGAYTTLISKGHVLVFYELCQNGSMESYLRNYSQRNELNATEYTDICANTYVNAIELSNLGDPEIATHLEKWCHEIASGMEFLVTKHVVHADLATRNVLLAENKTAKISDFGLSRRMYEYQNYFKSQQEPLPWRWMAPESLRRMEFGEKTDVWAFGITLWEMYSFGDVPYPGLSWNIDFVNNLEHGLRPNQPRHATPDLYNNIMKKCWEMLPSSRPTFAELKEMLK